MEFMVCIQIISLANDAATLPNYLMNFLHLQVYMIFVLTYFDKSSQLLGGQIQNKLSKQLRRQRRMPSFALVLNYRLHLNQLNQSQKKMHQSLMQHNHHQHEFHHLKQAHHQNHRLNGHHLKQHHHRTYLHSTRQAGSGRTTQELKN